MSRGFEVECPSNLETMVSGLLLSAKKTIRHVEWKCEIRWSGVKLYHEGKEIAWEKASAPARKFAHEFVEWWKASRELVSTQP